MKQAEISPELAEICGIHAGDGYLRYGLKNELDISGSIEEKSYYDDHVGKLFLNEFKLKINTRYFHHRNTYGFTTSNKEVIKSLKKMGFPSGKKSTIVEVPKIIINSSDSVKMHFIRGVFDTDGCFVFDKKRYNKDFFKSNYNFYPRIIISSCSSNLIYKIHEILHDLNFNSNMHIYEPRKTTENTKFKIQIAGKEMLNMWMEKIGSKNPTKVSRFLIWQKFGFCPPNTTYKERKKVLNRTLNPYLFYVGP